jgi:hypothetical protein
MPALFVHGSSLNGELAELPEKFVWIHLTGPARDVLGREFFPYCRFGYTAHLRAAWWSGTKFIRSFLQAHILLRTPDFPILRGARNS